MYIPQVALVVILIQPIFVKQTLSPYDRSYNK